jgi:hypothetical protein
LHMHGPADSPRRVDPRLALLASASREVDRECRRQAKGQATPGSDRISTR